MMESAVAHPSWHELAVAARIRFLANLAKAPPVELDSANGVTTVITGVSDNTLNGVFHARLDPARADAVIAKTVARFGRRQAPAIWWLDPQSTPADLPRRLEAAALHPEDDGIVRGGMVADVLARAGKLLAAATVRAAPGRDRVEVEAVRDAGGLDRWVEVAQTVWDDDAEDEGQGDLARRRELYLGLGLDPAAALQHWVAVDGDRAVGLATAFYAGQVTLVDHEDVVDKDRRRGVGTALLQAALTEGQRRGCRWVVLEPTPEGAPFYDALGLEVEPCRPGVEFYLPLEPPG